MNVIRHVNSIYSSNTYVVRLTSREWILVDCGDIHEIVRDAHEENVKISCVLLTHIHYDHIYGLNELLKEFPNLSICLSENGIHALYSDKLNYSKYHGTPYIYTGNNMLLVKGSSVINIGNVDIEIIATPGHTNDSLSYKINNYLFTGDSYIPGVKTVTNLRGGNRELAVESINVILHHFNDNMVLCPGHGEMIKRAELSTYISSC